MFFSILLLSDFCWSAVNGTPWPWVPTIWFFHIFRLRDGFSCHLNFVIRFLRMFCDIHKTYIKVVSNFKMIYSTRLRSLNWISHFLVWRYLHLYPHDITLLLLQNCQLNSIATPGSGSLTAQKRTGNENTGFSFVGCSITGSGPIYLGRAWGPNSRVVFIYCTFANIITPAGWFDWGVSSRDK